MKVVHCKRERYTHYIGRPGPFGNPFAIAHNKTRNMVIFDFEQHARQNKELLQLIYDLPENAVLGCWCKPLSCHGDVIIKLWKELHNKTSTFL